MFEIFLFLM
jgi:hypothetical protein